MQEALKEFHYQMGHHYEQLDATAETLREYVSKLQEQNWVSAARKHKDSEQYQMRAKSHIRRGSTPESKQSSKHKECGAS